jgi:hypothetical protein
MHAKPGLQDFIIAMQKIELNKGIICQASTKTIPSLSLVVYLSTVSAGFDSKHWEIFA